MNIANLQFEDYAAKKPLAITSAGKFLTASEVVSQPTLSLGSLHVLSDELQLKLAVKRYELERDFKLAITDVGIYTKDEIIAHLKSQSEFGILVRKVEMEYCGQLLNSLTSAAVAPAWPDDPKPVVPDVPEWRKIKRCIWIKVPTRALFCENTTDYITTPIANYRMANVHPAFSVRGFTVVALTGSNDTRANFIPQARNSLTVYISGVGHGNYNVYTGYMDYPILQVGAYDPAEVKAKAIHFLSCRTAAQLGPDTVSKGAKCYAGYTENFTFVWDDPSTPINEFQLFMRADSTFDRMMANGYTAAQAYDATLSAFSAAMAMVPGSAAATWLNFDKNHFRLVGSGATTILPYRYVRVCFPLASLEKQDLLVQAGEFVN